MCSIVCPRAPTKLTQPIFSHSLRQSHTRNQPGCGSASMADLLVYLDLPAHWKREGCLCARCDSLTHAPDVDYNGRRYDVFMCVHVNCEAMCWMPVGNTRHRQPNELKPIHFKFPSQTTVVAGGGCCDIFAIVAHVHCVLVSVTSARSIVYCGCVCASEPGCFFFILASACIVLHARALSVSIV